MKARPRLGSRLPLGLWKSRGKHSRPCDLNRDRPAKRSRYQRSDDADDTDDEHSEYYYLTLDNPTTPETVSNDEMDPVEDEADSSKVDDWEDLKELFARAAEQYERMSRRRCLLAPA
jgi:hypothetical protein